MRLNQYISAEMVPGYENRQLYNILNNRRVPLAALAVKPDVGEPVFQSGDQTIWNLECLISTKDFLMDRFNIESYNEIDELRFEQKPRERRKKTDIYIITLTGDEIRWYGAWRQYCLFSHQQTYTINQLTNIIDFLLKLKQSRRSVS